MAEEKKEEVPVEAAETADATPAEDKPAKAELKRPEVKLPKPDETELNAAIGVEQEAIAELQGRLHEIKTTIDGKQTGGSGVRAAIGVERTKLNEFREATKALLAERNAIYKDINAMDENRKARLEDFNKQKQALPFTDLDKIDKKVKELEMKQKGGHLSNKEEKDIVKQIDDLNKSKRKVTEYQQNVDQFKSQQHSSKMLYDKLKEKNAEVGRLRDQQTEQQKILDAMRSKGDAGKQDIPKLQKERDEIRKKVDGHYEAIRKLRDAHNEGRKAYLANQREHRAYREQEKKKQWAAEQEWREERKKQREAEEAAKIPWEEEMIMCDQLIEVLKKYVSAEPAAAPAKGWGTAKAAVTIAGATAIGKKADEGEMFMAEVMGGGKKKKGKKAKPLSSQKLNFSPDIFDSFHKIEIAAPVSASEAAATIDKVKAKKEYYKTAPPKKQLIEEEKKKKAAEKKKKEEEEEAAKVPADKPKAAAASGTAGDAKGKVDLKITPLTDSSVTVDISAMVGAAASEEEAPKKAKKLGGGGIEIDADDIAEDGGDGDLDDFLDAFA